MKNEFIYTAANANANANGNGVRDDVRDDVRSGLKDTFIDTEHLPRKITLPTRRQRQPYRLGCRLSTACCFKQWIVVYIAWMFTMLLFVPSTFLFVKIVFTGEIGYNFDKRSPQPYDDEDNNDNGTSIKSDQQYYYYYPSGIHFQVPWNRIRTIDTKGIKSLVVDVEDTQMTNKVKTVIKFKVTDPKAYAKFVLSNGGTEETAFDSLSIDIAYDVVSIYTTAPPPLNNNTDSTPRSFNLTYEKLHRLGIEIVSIRLIELAKMTSSKNRRSSPSSPDVKVDPTIEVLNNNNNNTNDVDIILGSRLNNTVGPTTMMMRDKDDDGSLPSVIMMDITLTFADVTTQSTITTTEPTSTTSTSTTQRPRRRIFGRGTLPPRRIVPTDTPSSPSVKARGGRNIRKNIETIISIQKPLHPSDNKDDDGDDGGSLHGNDTW